MLTFLIVDAFCVVVAAQRTEFEVASVKLHTSDDQRMMMVAQPGGRFVAANIPLRLLIRTAFQLQDDQLDGRYDIELKWTPEQPGQGRGGPGERPASDPDAVSIFTALQEQLGLRLSSTKDTVDVLVIDTLERPTPN